MRIERRSFLLGAGAAILYPTNSSFANVMPAGPPGLMKSFVSQPNVVKQACPMWCWAASASMIFAAYGHPTNQMQLVNKMFGGAVCAPAATTSFIGNVLSTSWIDDHGNPFQSQVIAAYDPANGLSSINNAYIVNHLTNNHPLLYGNQHHAMVVATVDYFNSPFGPQVQAVGVLDPFPGVPDYHPLSPPEMVPVHLGGQMTFLAAVQIT